MITPAGDNNFSPFGALADEARIDETETIAMPLVEEVLTIDKRVHDTAVVRIRTVTEEEAVTLRDTVLKSVVSVERAPIGRVVDVAPDVREEGDVTIIPILEEQVFTQKRLVLVEEVRITRTRNRVPVELPATRRVMRAVVERDDASNVPVND